jgi:hypothetical protein
MRECVSAFLQRTHECRGSVREHLIGESSCIADHAVVFRIARGTARPSDSVCEWLESAASKSRVVLSCLVFSGLILSCEPRLRTDAPSSLEALTVVLQDALRVATPAKRCLPLLTAAGGGICCSRENREHFCVAERCVQLSQRILQGREGRVVAGPARVDLFDVGELLAAVVVVAHEAATPR